MTRLFVLGLAACIAFGCSWEYPIWIPHDSSADPLYRFVEHGKAGFIDSTGRVVIPPKFEPWGNSGSAFHDGLLEIALSDGVYADRTGKIVIQKDLYRGWAFSEGLAVAMRKGEDLWGYIDTSGEFAISPRFASSLDDYVWSFSDGLARIKVKGNYGFIDHSGQFVIQPHLPDATDFHDGMARVVMEGPCIYFPDGPCAASSMVSVGSHDGAQHPECRFTYIDKSGNAITTSRFDRGRDFSEGLAPVRVGELWGFIDKKGNIVVAPKFEDAEPVSSGLSRIRKGTLYGYADKSGQVVVKPKFKYAESFSDGLAVVGDDAGVWYIDKRGEPAFPGRFAVGSPFFKGLAHVRLSGHAEGRSQTYAYIDHTGRRVFTYRRTD